MNSKKIVYLFFLMIGFSALAQRHEIGVQLGTSNLVGDIGKTKFINPFPNNLNNLTNEGVPFYGAIMYRLNVNPYQSVRFRLAYNHVQFSDKYAQELYRRNRGTSGGNSVFEGSAIFDYNFLPVNEVQKSMLSPYVFGGLSALLYTNGLAESHFAIGVPFGLGLKYKFNYQWALFGEFMFRPTNTDDIDYSQTYNLGNIYSKDWMNSMSLGLSYSFGRPPCYCD